MRLPEFRRIFEDKSFGDMVDKLNSLFNRGVTLKNNLSGQIIELTIPLTATGDVDVRHNLNVTPKYRIILKQRGDGIILDGDTPWDGTTAYFKSSQATEDITATILLMRE